MATFQRKRVSKAWKTVLTAAERDGVRFRLNSGRRTMAEQRALYAQNMLNGRPRPGRPLTAVPNPNAPHIRVGRADHALDVDSLYDGENKLQAWLRSKGLVTVNNVPGETWHMEASSEAALRALAKKLRRRPLTKHAQNVLYALRATKAGAKYPWRIIRAADRENVRLSLAFALVDQETGGTFRNVYGHDAVRNPIKSPPGGLLTVTRKNYAAYKKFRKQGLGMQGVGPAQLTYYTIQDLADREGGCWKPGVNIRIGLRTLAQNMRANGEHQGIARYNGSGSAAERYAVQVEQKQQKWHKILLGGKS